MNKCTYKPSPFKKLSLSIIIKSAKRSRASPPQKPNFMRFSTAYVAFFSSALLFHQTIITVIISNVCSKISGKWRTVKVTNIVRFFDGIMHWVGNDCGFWLCRTNERQAQMKEYQANVQVSLAFNATNPTTREFSTAFASCYCYYIVFHSIQMPSDKYFQQENVLSHILPGFTFVK